MPNLSLSPLRLLLLALFGSGIVLGGVFVAIIALWQPRPLEAMIPAEQTIALFSNVTREEVRIWGDQFPTLRSVPDFAGTLDLAILDIGQGSQGWILTSRAKDVPLPSANGDFHGQEVLLTAPEVMGTMTGNGTRLRESDVFRNLSHGLSSRSTRIYLRENAAALPVLLRPFVHASGALLLGNENGVVNLRVLGTSMLKNVESTAIPVPPLSPAPDVSLLLGNPQAILDTAMSALPEKEQTIRRGMLALRAQALLGGDWSFTYDILPLLQRPSAFHWRAATGTGGLSFTIHGETDTPRALADRLAALHDRLRSHLTGTTVIEHTFDKGFASAVLESDPSQLHDRRYSANGWTVRETSVRGGTQSLVSAVRGRQFMIGNRLEWMEELVTGAWGSSLPSLSSRPIAGGLLSSSSFQTMTAEVEHTPAWEWLQSLLHAEKGILWSVENDGSSLTLVMKPLAGNLAAKPVP